MKEDMIPNGEINLDDVLYPYDMDWSFDEPDIPFKIVHIFNSRKNRSSDSE